METVALANHEMGGSDAAPTYVARDPALRATGLELFPPAPGYPSPRAVIVFFGNDVGFWRPHRQLASGLARDGYAVVGVDIRRLFSGLTDDPAARADAVNARIASLVGRAYAEFEGWPNDSSRSARAARGSNERTPLVLAGHSLGAELAVWAASNVPVPALSGVLALSPGSRSHLRISASDLLMTGEPDGPGSFAVADAVRNAVARRPVLRLAIIRGQRDGLRSADAALLDAGGSQAQRFGVPFAGHSMKNLAIAGLVVRQALDWLLASPPASRSASRSSSGNTRVLPDRPYATPADGRLAATRSGRARMGR